MPLSTRQKQNLFVIIGASAMILASIVTTLYVASGRFNTSSDSRNDGQGYQNITFTDAVVTCKRYVERQFGNSLRTLEVDDHSSRLEHHRFIYKIFLKVETPAKERSGTALHYVNCFVNTANGKISKYETYEEKEETVAPVTEDGSNIFGWPR